MAGRPPTPESRARARTQRKIARELRAGTYRPRARELTVKARQLASYRPQVERQILALGIDGTDVEQQFRDAADKAYRDQGLQWLQTRLGVEYSDTREYAVEANKEPGNAHWTSRDQQYDELYFYHGAIWAFM